MKAELDIKPFLKAINEFHIAEQKPEGVQVEKWVGLIPLLLDTFVLQIQRTSLIKT